MKLNYKLLEAEFIDRPNRFITRIKFNSHIYLSHLPDPGRLNELLVPGAKVLIKKEDGINRKTSFSTQAVYFNNTIISLNTLLPNHLTEWLIYNKKLDFLKKWNLEKREIVYGKHRFDFKLSNSTQSLILEVKSVTLVENNIAKFPDCVTERGKKHVIKLGEMITHGIPCMILFIIQRPDVKSFNPAWSRDSKFCNALYDSYKKGLKIKVIKTQMNKNKIKYLGEVPFKLERNT